MLSEMRKKYGGKKGKNVFHAWINKMVGLGKFARSKFEKVR